MAKRKKKKTTNQRKLEANAKHLMAYRLRMAGAKLQDIADALGYKTESGAQKAILAGQRKLHIEPAIDAKELNKDRLEELLRSLWTAASKGALGSTDRVMRIIQELNKMDGNYAPTQVEITDWREELRKAGGEPAKIFEDMVKHFVEVQSDSTD